MSTTGKWVLLGAVGLVAVGVVAWVLWPTPTQPGQTQTQESAGVTVLATLAPGDALQFTVVLDTHTVDLSGYDVVANTRLMTPEGSLQPTGSSRTTDNTGHHIEATLTFQGIRKGTMTLVVQDLAGVPERRLEFPA